MQGVDSMVAVRKPQGDHGKEVLLFEKEESEAEGCFSSYLLKEIDVLP